MFFCQIELFERCYKFGNKNFIYRDTCFENNRMWTYEQQEICVDETTQ